MRISDWSSDVCSSDLHEFRLTPWHDDPVSDPGGEAFYIRDEQTGRFWSPTPLPSPGDGAYRVRHGFGYSVYEHEQDGLASELWVYVARESPVKFSVLRVRNTGDGTRRLRANGYVRTEKRRVGKECVGRGRSRLAPDH